MPKRAAPTSSASTATKKAKGAAAASKATPAAKGKATKSAVETVGETLKTVGKKVAEVVDNAGDLMVDDVADAAEKKGKKAGAAATRGTKRKAAAAADQDLGKKIAKAVDHAGSLLVDDVASSAAPSDAEVVAKKGKKAAAAAPATAARGTKRKTADDFMGKTQKAVATVADKVGSALSNVVREFGEASGLMEKAEDETHKTTKKGKATATTTKAAGKGKKAAQPEPESEDENAAEGSEASFIGAFESDEEMGGADSSDDESDAEDAAIDAHRGTVDVSKLPASKDDKTVAARLKKAAKKKGVERGTLYLGRIPHGFYEEEMKEYFNQFGDVTRLRLARNPKTGASRHYGYIEFSSLPVAEIVAETMHNYLLMGHLLKCEIIPTDAVHPELWVGANKKFRKVPRARLEKVRNDKPRTQEQQARANEKVLKRQEERRQKIKAAGIDYTFEGH